MMIIKGIIYYSLAKEMEYEWAAVDKLANSNHTTQTNRTVTLSIPCPNR